MEFQDQKLPTDQEGIQAMQRKLLAFAQEMYQTMQPGMTIAVSWTDGMDIIVPGRSPIVHELIITRPALSVRLKATKTN